MNGSPQHQIDALRTVGFWPGEDKLDVDRWLSNFDEGDKDTAIVLLSSFVFLSDRVVESLLVDAYTSLQRSIKMVDWDLVDGNGRKMKEPNVLFTVSNRGKAECHRLWIFFCSKNEATVQA